MSLQQRVHRSGRRDPEILQNLQTRICWLWTAVYLDSLFPSERKTGYTNNLLCQKRVYEAKCNNVCNVIRDLWRKRDSGSVSTNTCPSQPENAGKQVAGKTDPSGKVPLPATVCILKSPSPASLTRMIEAFSLVHFLKCIYLLSVTKIQCSVTSCCLLLEFAIRHLSSMPKWDIPLIDWNC